MAKPITIAGTAVAPPDEVSSNALGMIDDEGHPSADSRYCDEPDQCPITTHEHEHELQFLMEMC